MDACAVGDAGDRDPGAYDAVVVGGSIHHGAHQHELVAWARAHARHLDAHPSAFFSVCLAVADPDDVAAHRAAASWIDDFEDDTGWTADRRRSFAGALQYREYDLVTRFGMRLVMARGDHPTDIRTDVVYTDWDAVDAFAHEVAELAGIEEAAPAAR